ncbi:spore-associated protein A [Streptomyces meridianus]|uniref:Spore-associated protein A n=1 Tax=Streptomyces meridianus TaxID=2938945 RepID=A0ABT0XC97_9ACTN|nr:spore-associated protein A [Streptomyces meridianus]MCM2580131.1 spore-associated protein A [Streptomyces meridianus]
MKRSKRALTAALAATGMACAGLVATAPAASAATSGATAAYNGVCGSGYKVVNSAPVGSVGTVYLTYNSTSGKNCVVTIRNTAGSPTYMFAYLNTLDDPSDPAYDEGEYRSYAGPVYKYARGMCVEWGGIIGTWEAFNTGSNCGSLAARATFAGKD